MTARRGASGFRPRLYLFLPLVAGILGLPAIAFAGESDKPASFTPEMDLEHIFGFADGSDIGKRGEREIESITVGAFGALGSYTAVANETSLRYGVSDQLRLSLGTLTDGLSISGSPGLVNRSQVDFGGLIGELRILLLDRDTAPFGMTFSINPSWRRTDALSGDKTASYAVPATLLIDKALIPDTLYGVANLVYTPAFVRVGLGRGREDGFTAILGASYALAPRVFLGGEIRHETVLEDGAVLGHALFVGPNLFYRVSEVFTAKVAWAIQVPDVGARGLDLTGFQRHQIEVQIAYTF